MAWAYRAAFPSQGESGQRREPPPGEPGRTVAAPTPGDVETVRPTKNLAAELLERLVADQIRAHGKEFTDRLEEAVTLYQNRALTTVEVIEELIRIAKEINAARLPEGMSEEEFAFYQALCENESAVREWGIPRCGRWRTNSPRSYAARPRSTGRTECLRGRRWSPW